MEKDLELVLESFQQQMKTMHESLSKEIHGGLKGIRIYVDSNSEINQQKLDHLISINQRQNHSLAEHEKNLQTQDIKIAEFQPYINFLKGMLKKWYFTIGILLAFGIMGAALFHVVDFKGTFEKKTGIILQEEN